LQKDRALTGTGVLAVADAWLGEPGERPGLLPLPATRTEARAVGDVLLLGVDATRARLLGMLEREKPWRALHLAGHTVIDAERPLLSALVLAATPEDSGLLTLLDVLHLDVSADLVVLSSSESARGRAFPGEGVIGFPRAFLLCGVPRVIGALSCPDDDATAALMIRFHELWRSAPEDGAAAALRRAQDRVRQEERWAHPRYWAGWVLWGLGS
jgi:CHAT domain-containing protein